MASPISENAAEIYGSVPRTDASDTTDSPKTIPTPATEFAPKGHIIDDSARGTIFWEAEHSDDEAEVEDVSEMGESADAEPQSWGKPFRVEWISTNRLPFYRTRGLRNPWNANREVKIARDGTELEPNVGSKLVQLFHRLGSASTASAQSHGAYN
jgi:YT521-B-like domain